MKVRSPFFAACCIAATGISLLVSGCDRSESRARAAFADYQDASAVGDLRAARIALLKLVAAKDDDPTYWEELGKIQLQLKAYPEAYYAYTRAHELDRANTDILATMVQLSLLGGNIDVAEQHTRELSLVAPDHPAVKLAYGYIALRRSDLDEADRQVDALLQTYPYDPGSKLLKARILLARGKAGDAAELLRAQLKAKPDDAGSLKALLALYQRDSDWNGIAATAGRLYALSPKSREAGLAAVDAAFRIGDIPGAIRASEPFLKEDAPPDDVDDVLRVWADRWKSPAALDAARRLVNAAPDAHRLAFAGYFNSVGSPTDAVAIVGDTPRLPVTVSNMSLNSIIADSMGLMGRTTEAKRLFDAVLAKEPDHVYALRGRINLEIRTRDAKAAIKDAQRLVSVLPNSARDRLLLAKAYAAAGDQRQLDRSLWNAFHEIPGNRDLYEALRQYVARSGPSAVQGVDEEYRQQRDDELTREFI